MKNSLFVVCLLCASAPSFAQTYEKNHLPCVVEICLGDGLPELQKVKWDRAQSPLPGDRGPTYVGSSPIESASVANLKRTFRGRVDEAAPYLALTAFDQKGLRLLKDVTGACSYQAMEGRYTSQGGNLTQVRIALLPGEQDVRTQRWTVVAIERHYPAAVTPAQQRDVKKELLQRYGRFESSRRTSGVQGQFKLFEDYASSFGFLLSMVTDVRDEDFKRYPTCESSQKIQVD
jgi:hypothetical protein